MQPFQKDGTYCFVGLYVGRFKTKYCPLKIFLCLKLFRWEILFSLIGECSNIPYYNPFAPIKHMHTRIKEELNLSGVT